MHDAHPQNVKWDLTPYNSEDNPKKQIYRGWAMPVCAYTCITMSEGFLKKKNGDPTGGDPRNRKEFSL